MKSSLTHFFKAFSLMFLFLGTAATASADTEPNNSLAEANAIPVNFQISGDLGGVAPIDAQDWYQIVTNEDGDLTVTFNTAGSLIGNIAILRKNGGIGASSSNGSSVSTTLSCLRADTVYIRLSRASGMGTYSMTNSLAIPALSSDPEPNDSDPEATPILLNQMNTGHLGYNSLTLGNDFQDWYQLVTTTDGNLTVNLDVGGDFTASIGIFAKNGGLLASSSNTTTTISTTEFCRGVDTVYIRISRAAGCGDYSFNVTQEAASYANDIEPNNILSQGNPLAMNTIQTGHLGYDVSGQATDAADYFTFVLPEDGDVTATAIFDSTLVGTVGFFLKNGGFLGGSSNGTGVISFTTSCRAADTLSLRITRASGCGGYQVIVDNEEAVLDNDIEPNDIIGEINTSITKDDTITGHLGYFSVSDGTDATDYFYLISQRDATITFTAIMDSSLVGTVGLFYKNGGFLGGSSNGTGIQSFSVSCLAEDTIVGRVTRASGCGSYEVSFTETIPPFIDDVEPNGVIASAIPIAFGQIKYGHLGYSDIDEASDNFDFYEFNVPTAPLSLTIEATYDSSLLGSIGLFNSGGGFLGGSSNGTGVVSFTTTVTTPGTYYARLVRAAGCGSYWISSGPFQPCAGPPQNLIATNIKATTATLSWAPVRGAIRYTVRGGIQGIGAQNYLVFERPIGAPTSLNAIILKPNVTYEWQVQAHCSQDNSLETPYSTLNTFTTLGCDSTTADSTTMITTTTARLNWTTSPVALAYEIVGSEVGSSSILTVKVNGGASDHFDVAGLMPGKSYIWGVRVLCNSASQPRVASPISNLQTFTTLTSVSKGATEAAKPDQFESWMVYPNPAQQQVQILIDRAFDRNEAMVRIYNLNGSELMSAPITSNTVQLDIGELSNGMYMVGIRNADGRQYMKRLMIAR